MALPRHALALALLAAAGLTSCAAPSEEPPLAVREDAGLYEANVREWVQAMELGMARARLEMVRRAARRMMQSPG